MQTAAPPSHIEALNAADARRALARGYPIALASAALLSTTAIFIRYLTNTYAVPALVLALWRDIFVVATLLPVLAFASPRRLRVTRPQLRYLLLYGLGLSVFNALWTLSVALNGAAAATVLVYCSVGFTAVLGRWLFAERLDAAKVLAVALSLGGCVLVSRAYDPGAWRSNVLGIATGVLSGLGYASYTLMGRSASRRGLDPWTTLLYTFGGATIFLLAFNLIPGGIVPGGAKAPAEILWLGSAWAGWAALFMLAAGPTVFGFGLYNVSLTYLASSVVNLIVTLEPIFTALIAYAVLGERLAPLQIAGGFVILSGVVVLRLDEERRAREVSGTRRLRPAEARARARLP